MPNEEVHYILLLCKQTLSFTTNTYNTLYISIEDFCMCIFTHKYLYIIYIYMIVEWHFMRLNTGLVAGLMCMSTDHRRVSWAHFALWRRITDKWSENDWLEYRCGGDEFLAARASRSYIRGGYILYTMQGCCSVEGFPIHHWYSFPLPSSTLNLTAPSPSPEKLT